MNYEKTIRCVYVSTIDAYKHQWNVIKAIKLLRNKGFNLEITFIGDGHGKANRMFTKERKLSDPKNEFISHYKFVEHNSLIELLSDFDIFVFASSCESISNILLEGIESGLPIVCSDRGPLQEVLGKAGLYFDPESVNSIANSIENIITMEENRKQIIFESLKKSNQFSWDDCAKKTFQYLLSTYYR
jgi:glycosyltransferase involved in cell wall biosynthesis